MRLFGIFLTIVIIGVLLAGAYAFYRQNQVLSLGAIVQRADLSTLHGLVAFFGANAPFVCTQSNASAPSTSIYAVYHDGAFTRIDFHFQTDKRVMHEVISNSGFYEWYDDAPYVGHVPPESYASVPYAASNARDLGQLLTQGHCSIWWSPDDTMFALPAKPINEAMIGS